MKLGEGMDFDDFDDDHGEPERQEECREPYLDTSTRIASTDPVAHEVKGGGNERRDGDEGEQADPPFQNGQADNLVDAEEENAKGEEEEQVRRPAKAKVLTGGRVFSSSSSSFFRLLLSSSRLASLAMLYAEENEDGKQESPAG